MVDCGSVVIMELFQILDEVVYTLCIEVLCKS